MERVKELKSLNDWKDALLHSSQKPLVLFKHSTRCPVSAEAYDAFLKHVAKEPNPEADYRMVLVVEERPVSNAVAEDLGVKHESPQLLFIKNGETTWHTSHWRITEDSLRENLK